MATYFVRKTGSDAYTTTQAQTASTAWLTIDKAANEVAAGDTVVVGAGTYRELVTMDTAGSSGSEIMFVADVDGSLGSGDPGLVVVTAYTDSETMSARTTVWDMNGGKEFITVRGFVLDGGTFGPMDDSTSTANSYEGVVVEDCVLIGPPEPDDSCILVNYNDGTTPTGDGLIIRRCVFDRGGIHVIWDGNETADQDAKMTVESCVFIGALYGTVQPCFRFDKSSSGTYSLGGVDIRNCTMLGVSYGVVVEEGASTTYPINVRNCVINAQTSALYKWTTNDGALTSDYNTFSMSNGISPYTNVTAGTDDVASTSTWMLGGIHDIPLRRFWGWSPFSPFEPMRNSGGDDWTSLIGTGDTATAAATDLYDNPKPMYGTVDDRGAVEGRARPEQETTTVRTGSNAIRLEGAGYAEWIIPVDASSTTVTIYGQYDGSYTGTLPTLEVLNIPGQSDQSDVQTGASGSWEELTATFTPTAAGICRVRFVSSDTSAAGKCFADDLTVT